MLNPDRKRIDNPSKPLPETSISFLPFRSISAAKIFSGYESNVISPKFSSIVSGEIDSKETFLSLRSTAAKSLILSFASLIPANWDISKLSLNIFNCF